jgi:hypothetical protein
MEQGPRLGSNDRTEESWSRDKHKIDFSVATIEMNTFILICKKQDPYNQI